MNTTPYTNEEITEMTAHHTLHMQEGCAMTDAEYQAMEDEQFNSSVWEDWEAKVQAEIDRDHALNAVEADRYGFIPDEPVFPYGSFPGEI